MLGGAVDYEKSLESKDVDIMRSCDGKHTAGNLMKFV